jgi:hypothetical protein
MLLLQYDDRDTKEFEELIKQNKNYAYAMGMNYLNAQRGYESIPPWWRKVFLARELLSCHDGVLWVDTDAAIVSSLHPSDLLKDKHFIYSPNPPMLNNPSLGMLSAPFCAGIWAVKNSPEGRQIMDAWINCYNANHWKKTDKGWKGEGAYAGYAYEQGAFELAIVRCQDFQPWIQSYPSHVLNYLPKDDTKLDGTACPSTVFAVHYWKGNRHYIDKHWPQLL